ncbi:uncharacterized protein LOC125667409 [Ostrea edulis]|uniref:uncharacterized protein LOC125667409 n=1 Tax=Ostrea edulis TaxID=37623 RepID=UPI0024AF51CA|nr:uncharacterized protein LOC125667409 [Ostrea edulis]
MDKRWTQCDCKTTIENVLEPFEKKLKELNWSDNTQKVQIKIFKRYSWRLKQIINILLYQLEELGFKEDEFRRLNDKVKQLQQKNCDLNTQIKADAQKIADDGSKIRKLQHDQEVSLHELGIKEDEVRRLNDKVKQLQQKNCDLNTQTETDAQKIAYDGSKIKKLQYDQEVSLHELSIKEDEVRRLNDKVKQLQQKNCDLNTQIEIDAQKIADDGSKIKKLQHDQEVSLHEMTTRDQVILKLRTDLVTMQEKDARCLKELKIREDEVKRLNNKVAQLQQEILDLNRQIQRDSEKKLQHDQEAALQKVNKDIHLLKMIRRREESIEQLQEDLEESKAQHSACYNELLESLTQNDIQCVKNEKNSQEITQLQDQLHQIKQELAISQEKHRTCQNEVRRREDSIEQLQEDLEESKAQHSACYNELLKTQNDIQCLKNDNSHMNQTTQANSQEINQLRDQLHLIKQELAISQEKHRTCENEVRRRDEYIEQLQEDLEESKAQYSSCYNELLKTQNDIQCLKNDNSHMNQTTQANSQEINQLQDQLHQIKQELAISQEKHRTCQDEVRRSDESIEQLQEDLEESKAQHSACYNELLKTQNDFQCLKNDNSHMNQTTQDQVHQIKQELSISQEKHRTCQNEVRRKDESIEQLKEDLEKSKAQYSACYNELLKRQNDIQCLKNDNSHMNQATQANSQEINHLRDQLHQIKQELAISQEKHRTCQNEVRRREESIKQLQEDFMKFKAQYSACYNMLLKTQNYIQCMKNNKSCMKQVTQTNFQETSQLQDQLHQIKQELAISQEKHITCQNEVRL